MHLAAAGVPLRPAPSPLSALLRFLLRYEAFPGLTLQQVQNAILARVCRGFVSFDAGECNAIKALTGHF